MTPEAARWIRMGISALTAGVIGAAGIIVQAAATNEMIQPITWIIAAATGLMLAAKNVESYLSQPPPSLGGAPIVQPPSIEPPPPRVDA